MTVVKKHKESCGMICRKHVGWFDIGQRSFFIKPQLQGQSSFSVTMLPPGGYGALLQWCLWLLHWWQVRIFCPVSQKNCLQSYLRLSSTYFPQRTHFTEVFRIFTLQFPSRNRGWWMGGAVAMAFLSALVSRIKASFVTSAVLIAWSHHWRFNVS